MTPEYFRWHLRPYEAEHYLEGVMMRKRDGWEQARLIVSPLSGKDAKPIVFPWEKETFKAPTEDEFADLMNWAEAQKNTCHG
jgi:hypothetical protein